jgi:hypothetical protein
MHVLSFLIRVGYDSFYSGYKRIMRVLCVLQCRPESPFMIGLDWIGLDWIGLFRVG